MDPITSSPYYDPAMDTQGTLKTSTWPTAWLIDTVSICTKLVSIRFICFCILLWLFLLFLGFFCYVAVKRILWHYSNTADTNQLHFEMTPGYVCSECEYHHHVMHLVRTPLSDFICDNCRCLAYPCKAKHSLFDGSACATCGLWIALAGGDHGYTCGTCLYEEYVRWLPQG